MARSGSFSFSPARLLNVLTVCILGVTLSTFRSASPVHIDYGAILVRDLRDLVPLANVRHAPVPLCVLWFVATHSPTT